MNKDLKIKDDRTGTTLNRQDYNATDEKYTRHRGADQHGQC